MIASHDRFFTRMIGMIPTELYQHTDSVTGFKNDTPAESKANGTAAPKPEKVKKVPLAPDATMEDINSKYYKHKKLPLTANEKKLVRQERKKRKYEPSQSEVEEDIVPSSSKMEVDNSDDESEASGGDDNEEETKKAQITLKKDVPAGNLDELRKRLQDRIAHLREQRQTKKPRTNEPKPNGHHTNQQKQDAASVTSSTVNSINNQMQNGKATSTATSTVKSSATDSLARAEALQQELHAAPTEVVVVSSSGLEFNPITQTEESISAQIRQLTKKKDGGKKARLERLLKEAEQKRQRLTTMMKSNDEDQQAKARAEQWNDVMTVASGGKALLVSTIGHNAAQATSRAEQKIKKALKKRDKKKEKSATEWNERLHTLDEEQQARLKKRDDNLKNKKTRHLGPAGGVVEGEGGGGGAEGEGEQPKKRPRLGGPNGIKGGAARSQNEDSSHNNSSSSHSHSKNNSSSSKRGGSGGGSGDRKGGSSKGGNTRRAGFEGKKTNSAFLNKK